jgi:hypothetical protein
MPLRAIALLSLLIWLVYGAGHVGYDQLYALLWGDELAEGRLPGYEAARAPTPHPLANLVGLGLAPLGDGSLAALKAIAVVSFAGLAVAAYQLGARLFSAAVGVLFAALLLTRAALVNQALIASIDVPFLALVLTAAAIEVRRPRAGVPVLLVLGAAGLLRPEAWLLAGAYLVLVLRDADARTRAKLVALAAAPPLLWIGSDLAITGDPLWSFHQARDTAERMAAAERYGDGGVGDTLEFAGRSWKGLLHAVPALVSAAGVALAAWALRRRAAVPLAMLAIGAAAFLAIGFAGLPLLTRYFLVPATLLCLFAAVAVLGWRELPRGMPVRRAAGIGGALAALALLAAAPHDLDQVDGALVKADRGHEVQRDLREIAGTDALRARLPGCRPIQTRVFRARPTLLWQLRDGPPAEIVATRRLAPRRRGLLLVYAREETPPATGGYAPLAGAGHWRLLARCGGSAATALSR